MLDAQVNNRRIAKNTLLLYIRMLFTIVVSLYTSRVILQTLGVVDYGIYNVVGGIAVLFSFITASMSQAIQRFITFELGKGSVCNIKKIFSVGIEMQVVISLAIMLLVEVVGLWMISYKLQIPADRIPAAYWILQFTILTIPITLLSSPYHALIIAYEKMQAFAYISIFEVTTKLAIAYALLAISFDHLILYGFLYMVVMLLVQVCYVTYCKRKIPEVSFKYTKDWTIIEKIVSFAGWNMYGALAYVGFTQGLNILLNMFFNPAINAARGIAVQVQSIIYGFVVNFQTAINPQITKTCAANEISIMHSLIFRSAKFSLILIALMSIPVLIEAPYILELWLKDVPESTSTFVRIIILTSWIAAIENPITYAVQASGEIKKYQIVVSTIRLSILPISYTFLAMGFPAFIVFIVHFFVDFSVIGVRLRLLQPIIDFPIWKFLKEAVGRDLIVIFISMLLLYPLYKYLESSLVRFLCIIIAEFVCISTLSYFISLNQVEKNFVNALVKKVARIR